MPSGSASYSYDEVGNRTDQGGTYAAGNRTQQFAGCSYVADSLGDGNVLSRTCGSEVVRFWWTAESRLAALQVVGGDSIDFRYDASGRLVRRDVNTVTQAYYLWQGESLLAELTASATAKVAEYSYYPGLDNPHAVITGSTAYFAHTDGIANVIVLTDSATQSTQREYVYDSWGRLTGGNDYKPFLNADRARFKGALWIGPQLDLYFMRARWYEPKTGRFLSEDPTGLEGGINTYTFAGSDPINHRDPTGLDCRLETFTYKDDEGKEQTGTKLVCGGGGGGGLGAGDLWTMESYFGSPLGALRFLWSTWRWPTPGNSRGSWGAQCQGGFPGAYCTDLVEAFASLITHSSRQCSALGTQGAMRFQAGNYRFEAGWVLSPSGARFYASENEFPRVRISRHAWHDGLNITNVVAHEEAHVGRAVNFVWHALNLPDDPINALARECAGPRGGPFPPDL